MKGSLNGIRQMAKRVAFVPLDTIKAITGLQDPMVPPRSLYFGGDGNFRSIGNEFLRYFIELAQFQRYHRVLDVGSGIGRMAVPMTQYLTDGEYDGIDIVKVGVDWCQQAITSRYPNFRFQLADVYNGEYHPDGRQTADQYRFPFSDETFDRVLLTSVFTHMLPPDVSNYLREIARVLKTGGVCLITWFVLNQESLALDAAGKSRRSFPHDFGDYRSMDGKMAELAVAYRDEFIARLYGERGLQIQPPIHYGSWCGREQFLSYQDIVIAHKTRSNRQESRRS